MENFKELLQKELDKLPYTKHLDDGQYNDGQVAGFELGARWALSLFAVSGRSEQFNCGKERVFGEQKCDKQCNDCIKEYGSN